uniref:Ribosomal protein L16 n=1 Tax=Balbiania investiens TaxID=111861 RepID=A0A4D6BP39_9FLOR
MTSHLEKKRHNNYNVNANYKQHTLHLGDFGIKALHSGRIPEAKLQCIVKSLNKKLKTVSKGCNPIKMWTFIFMNSTLTALSPESRMGKGKGSVYTKFSHIKIGQIVFEFSNISLNQAMLVYKHLKNKFTFSIKLVKNE